MLKKIIKTIVAAILIIVYILDYIFIPIRIVFTLPKKMWIGSIKISISYHFFNTASEINEILNKL